MVRISFAVIRSARVTTHRKNEVLFPTVSSSLDTNIYRHDGRWAMGCFMSSNHSSKMVLPFSRSPCISLLFYATAISGFVVKHDNPSHSFAGNGERVGNGPLPTCRHPHPNSFSSSSSSSLLAHLSEADKDRLLLGEEGLTAFIVAEMEHFVNATMVSLDEGSEYGTKWKLPDNEKLQMGLVDENKVVVNEVYVQSCQDFNGKKGGDLAVDLICNVTEQAFREGFREQGLLSALGSAILYFRGYYRTPRLIAACERIGLSDYAVAHHITDMYHHRSFRGTYTKTLPASGKGEIAARIAVGLDQEDKKLQYKKATNNMTPFHANATSDLQDEEEDECLVWSPTNPDVCIHWKSDDEKWRKTRFERIQMEGTKDPRRGGSGTTR